MTNGNIADPRILAEEWHHEFVNKFGHPPDAEDGYAAGYRAALSVCADGGMGEAVYQYKVRDLSGWHDCDAGAYERITTNMPEHVEARTLFTAPQAIGKGEAWISVKDALPPIGRNVLCYIPESSNEYTKVKALARFQHHEDAIDYYWDNQYPGRGNMHIDCAVTHWRDLPKGPDAAPQAECAPREKQNVMNIPLDAAAAMADYAPQAECAPHFHFWAQGKCRVCDISRECAPREAQPNWKALHAAADAVAASADIWAGFSTQDAKVCVDAYLAAPTPERAQGCSFDKYSSRICERGSLSCDVEHERAQESAGVRLTDDWLFEKLSEIADEEIMARNPKSIIDVGRQILAKKEGA
jgi:hypothetical protein